MFHGVVFVTYNQQGGPRGEGMAESTNYFMFMEQVRLGSGTMLRRQMFSGIADLATPRLFRALSDR
jgi:hypothetical protein